MASGLGDVSCVWFRVFLSSSMENGKWLQRLSWGGGFPSWMIKKI
jgi:hypothetical protein